MILIVWPSILILDAGIPNLDRYERRCGIDSNSKIYMQLANYVKNVVDFDGVN